MEDHAKVEDTFLRDLTALIPQLRAFAHSMCRNAAEADDLAQECVARAWAYRARYQPGTNLKAWTFTILRNLFYSQKRQSWRQTAFDWDLAERTLTATSNPDATLELNDVRLALDMLSDDHREALILVGVAGLPYAEASQICGCAEGTIKSRVSRARTRLAEILAGGDLMDDHVLPHASLDVLVTDAQRLCRAAA